MIHKEDCCCPCCQIPRLEKTIAEQAEQIRQLINLVALAEGRDTKQAEQIGELQQEIATRNDTMNATVEELMSAQDENQRLKKAGEWAVKKLRSHHSVRAGILAIADNLEQALAATPQKRDSDG